jgi:hypothetical protein
VRDRFAFTQAAPHDPADMTGKGWELGRGVVVELGASAGFEPSESDVVPVPIVIGSCTGPLWVGSFRMMKPTAVVDDAVGACATWTLESLTFLHWGFWLGNRTRAV